MEEAKRLYGERLGRYQAAIALGPVDRISTAFNTTHYAINHSGYSLQQIMYEPRIWAKTAIGFAKKYPEIDTFQPNFQWAPAWDAINRLYYRIPGRDIPVDSLHQYIEKEYMKANEYRLLINDPVGYRMNHFFPRVFGEFGKGSIRSHMAFLKAGLAQGLFAAVNREATAQLADEAALPVSTAGMFLAPFDYISDYYRGLSGIVEDMFRQPENVIEACEAILPDMVNRALATADPQKRLPIFNPTHKPCFISPKQFDTFYWPTFKKGIITIIEAGWKVRIFLEGNWSPHWHHIAEFPKGTVLCDVDNEADIFEAKKAFGHKQCISGGIPTDMLILGTPEEIRARVKHLCETVGADGGWIPNGGGHIPRDTNTENFRSLLDAVMEYGKYSQGPVPEPQTVHPSSTVIELPEPRFITPWEVIKCENEWTIPGDEELIKDSWEKLEVMAYNWLISW